MTTAITLDTTAAEHLWNELRNTFIHAEKLIQNIITLRAWEPLGYTTFTEAWTDRMAGIRLTTVETRARVVYAMLDDGLTEHQVAEQLPYGSGVTPEAVATLHEQKTAGVPVEAADIIVRQHNRRRPGPRRSVTIELTAKGHAHYSQLAHDHNMDITTVFRNAGIEAFEALDG